MVTPQFRQGGGCAAVGSRQCALFFESDMLFRLGTYRAVVRDVPMDAHYGDEVSNLKIGKELLPEFLRKHVRNFSKRIFYTYFFA